MRQVANVILWGLTIALMAVAVFLVGGAIWGPDGGAPALLEKWLHQRKMALVTRERWSELIDEGGNLGRQKADAVIVEFGDYGCSFCKTAHDSVMDVVSPEDASISVVYRHFPLSSEMAARLSICAEQFGLFELMHDHLMTTEEWSQFSTAAEWAQFAEQVAHRRSGEWHACLQSSATSARLDRDKRLAELLGIRATPTFVGLGGVVEGAHAIETIREVAR